jgi:hypothetical protein
MHLGDSEQMFAIGKELNQSQGVSVGVLPTVLYACKTWTVSVSRKTESLPCKLPTESVKMLKWSDMVLDTEVPRRSGMISIPTIICKAQLKRAGHVRMPDHRLPKKLLYGELQVQKRSQDGQKKRLKTSLKHCCIDSADWENVATDRSVWRCKTGTGATKFEKERIHDVIQKRSLHNLNHTTAQSSSPVNNLCNSAKAFSGLF